MRTSALELLENRLKAKAREQRGKRFRYLLPSLWLGGKGKARAVRIDHPYQFFLESVREIRARRSPRRPRSSGGGWTRNAIIYNMFVRTTAAFDHDGNGKLDIPINRAGFTETGTFLKSIAMLPYIRSMGVNTIHLLPITAIGQDGNKGTLGSPYAIRNPYEIDPSLAERSLALDAKTEFRAFVEAAHKFGMRMVLEFVFRTASKDADWVKEHPEWFYWIWQDVQLRRPGQADETKYGSPVFHLYELDRIHADVQAHRFDDLLPPHKTYRAFFALPPPGVQVTREEGRYVGVTADGKKVKIPGAFADWPPDDNQPPWGDVTYLRMYTHPDFNYIAYNTIRMYDTELARPEYINRPLWDMIAGIVPYYQDQFGIDGVMIDMGHALPMSLKKEIVARARQSNSDFAFWDENFSIARKSLEEGYNAVFGFLWIDQHHPARMRSFCRRCSTEGFPISFFATPENHNTPRAASRSGGLMYSRWSWIVNCFLPAVPFIHSGFELGERHPINTGLDFSPEQLRHLPSEKLPLFSEYAYNWCRKEQFAGFVAQVAEIRERYSHLATDQSPQSFHLLQDPNEHVLAFARISSSPRIRLAVVTNMNFRGHERTALRLETHMKKIKDLLSDKTFEVNADTLSIQLKAGQCIIFEY